MHYKVKAPRAIFMVFAVVLMILISLVCIAPLWHVLMGSFSNPTNVNTQNGLILFPMGKL